MRISFLRKLLSLSFAITLFAAPSLFASDRDRDDDKDKKKSTTNTTQLLYDSAGKVSACELGSASARLNVNNVDAELFNNGGLFWQGAPEGQYEVPKGSQNQAIFASGIWIGGLADGALRMAAATYSNWEFWPGPLDDAGNAPVDCAAFDRMYRVSRADIDNFVEGRSGPTADMTDWPASLGAPVKDGDGDPNNYNLAGGDLPDILGDQSVWWIMNDAGNIHQSTGSQPIGLQVEALAFSFNQAGVLGNSTFYKYKLTYKGSVPLTDTYLGLWSDPDLGGATDDYVASDSVLGLGIVYNGDNDDTSYGTQPPAVGYDFFQGPLVDNDGVDNNRNGEVDEPGERLGMSAFVYYNNDGTNQGNPRTGTPDDWYGYLTGFWKDKSRITFGGNGVGFSNTPTRYMYPATPPAFWSEDNIDGKGGRNQPADRRFIMSSGPFTMQPGETQEIVFGIVWSQSVNRIASVLQLKLDDIVAQGAFDANFDVPAPPSSPNVQVLEDDGQVTLSWSNLPSSNNYLDQYEARSPFLSDPAALDTTMSFEGYVVYEYTSDADVTGRVVATYDLPNNVTTITGPVIDVNSGAVVSAVLVPGNDGGVQHSHTVEKSIYGDEQRLRNYTTYYFGVQAYAYNAFSTPGVYFSPITRVTVVPAQVTAAAGGTSQFNADLGLEVPSSRLEGVGDAFGVFANVIDPSRTTGATYNVRIYDDVVEAADTTAVLTYDITNVTTGTKIVDGAGFIDRNKKNVPFGSRLIAADGLEFSVDTAPPTYTSFEEVANATGVLDPPQAAAFDFQGFPTPGGANPSSQAGGGAWAIHTGDNGARGSFDAFLDRSSNGGAWASRKIVPFDFEWRFTAEGSIGYDPFCTGLTMAVPFELWRIGAGTPDDASDDVRMVPYILDNDFNGEFNLNTTASIAAGDGGCASAAADHSGSSLNNDPFTDWVYWVTPEDETPGDAGYRAWEAAAIALGGGDDGSFYGTLASDNSIRRTVLVNWNGGDVDVGVYDQDMPETGTVLRIVTSKPLANGDLFQIDGSGLEAVVNDAAALEDALAKTTVVPNPYLGASSYEVSRVTDQVRITNLPRRATIRIFTLNGTLIRQLEKDNDARFVRWDLTTEEQLPVASGMYLIHVETRDSNGGVVGEKVLKFAAVKKRVQLQEL